MKVVLFITILSFFIICCSSKQQIMRGESNNLSALSPKERAKLDSNWSIGTDIWIQDGLAWIASDSLQQGLRLIKPPRVDGYIAKGDMRNGLVFLYYINADSFVHIVGKVVFENGSLTSKTATDSISTDSEIINTAKCIEYSKRLNNDFINKQGVGYNTYSFYSDSTIIIYLAPGSTDRYSIWGGGVRSIFSSNLSLISNTYLHRSIVSKPSNKTWDIFGRSSSITNIINEIDIAQSMIFKKDVYNQVIITPKYTFVLYYIPDEDTFIRQVYRR